MAWTKWKARMRGEKVMTFTQPDADDEGYYRMPIKSDPENKRRITGWKPVCYFVADGELTGMIGAGEDNREMSANEVVDAWTWVCAYPISEEWYRAVAEQGKPWPDALANIVDLAAPVLSEGQVNTNFLNAITADIPAANRDVEKTDNKPPVELAPEAVLAETIGNAVGAAKLMLLITDEEIAAAAGMRNRLNELKLDADKTGRALFDPHYKEYKRIYDIWIPLAKKAEDAAKDLFTRIKKREQEKRDESARIQKEIDDRNAEIAEANQRAADRAIAAGEPEPPPVVVEPVAAPVVAAPAARVTASYGRAAPLVEKTFVVIDNFDDVYKHFKAHADVQALLTKLAQSDVTAGLTVPGTHTRRGVI